MPEMLADYAPIVGDGVVRELRLLGDRLSGTRVLNVNSTRVGGGVAEILNRLVPLLNEVGLQARWEVVQGTQDFFALTKNLHNALHGAPYTFTPQDAEVFNSTTEINLRQEGGRKMDLAMPHRCFSARGRGLGIHRAIRAALRFERVLGATIRAQT